MMEPLFCMRQLVKKYRENKRQLCMVFIDLEKAYNRVTTLCVEVQLMKKSFKNVY